MKKFKTKLFNLLSILVVLMPVGFFCSCQKAIAKQGKGVFVFNLLVGLIAVGVIFFWIYKFKIKKDDEDE